MSYDLYGFQILPGQDPQAVFESHMEMEEAGNFATWTHELEARAEELVTLLLSFNPRLERFKVDSSKLGEIEALNEADARAEWRSIELNAPEEDNPVQIFIEPDRASINIPYWFTGDRARDTITEALSYFAVVEGEAQFATFDPQIGRVLDISADLALVISTYEEGSVALAEIVEKSKTERGGNAPKRKKRFGLF